MLLILLFSEFFSVFLCSGECVQGAAQGLRAVCAVCRLQHQRGGRGQQGRQVGRASAPRRHEEAASLTVMFRTNGD